jgi:NADP-dependent 3-hydroxy acid dehydrogenase YdfG
MKVLITGGNRGLGKTIASEFGADCVSRQTGHDITKEQDLDVIAKLSLDYTIFINNAFDGPPHEPWANFGQVNLLYKVYQEWKNANKSGWIFNIGSIGEKHVKEPDPMFETYRTAKAALSHASRQCTSAFKNNIVLFKTSLITLDRLDTELSRSRESWTGNGIDCNDIVNFINYSTNISANTCIEEVSFYVNFHSK